MSLGNTAELPDWHRQHGLAWMNWLVCTVAAMLASCAAIPPYPASLPALVQADTTLEACPPIAGSFADMGTATALDGRILGSVSLTRLLHPGRPDDEKADVVVVRGPERDVVEIESFRGPVRLAVWRQPKVTKEAYLAKGDRVVAETYLCQEGFVRLGRRYDVGGGGTPGVIALGVKSDFLWLRKAVDGSLMALHTNYDYVAINLVLPVGNIEKIWYRFPSAPAPSGTAPDASLRATHGNAARP